jgi:sensor histidine kinase YesM
MIHPITGNRTRFIAWWLIWLLTGLGQSLLIYFVFDHNVYTALFDGMISALIYSLIGIAIWFPATQFKPQKGGMIILALNHIAIGTISLGIWLFGAKWIVSSIIQDGGDYAGFWDASIYFRIGAGIFIYAVIVLSYNLMMTIENIARNNIREVKLENMLNETELMMLRSQINPHFLFNTLNSISSLTITDPSKAREMVIKLSEFMRYALSRKQDKAVTLSTELENLRLYLDIEKVRFGSKLRFDEDIDQASLEVKIPNMILQPLYENAIKHGVYESIEEVIVTVVTKISRGRLAIVIENDFDPDNIPARGTGTGLRNVRRRLELFYNNDASLETRKIENRFVVEINLPIENN